MPDPTVKMTFTGDEKSAERALAKLEKKYDQLDAKMRKAGQAQKHQHSQFMHGVGHQVMHLAKLAAGYASVHAAIHMIVHANKEVLQQISELATILPEAKLKAQIQMGATPEQFRKLTPGIQKALLETPSTTYAGAFDITRQLSSSAVKEEDIKSGAALRATLAVRAATNQFGREMGAPSESLLPIMQFAKALGVKEPGAAEIAGIGGPLTQLFEKSDIQFVHLKDLAGDAAALKGFGVNMQQQLAAFSTLVDVMAPPEAATALRQMAVKLRGASQSGEKKAAFRSVGLNTEDFDLIGEDLPTALERLKAAQDKVDPKKFSNFMISVFGEKAVAGAMTLVSKADVVRDREKILKGGSFVRNVGLFQSSEVAARERLQLRKDFALEGAKQRGGNFTEGDLDQIIKTSTAEKSGKNLGFLGRLDYTVSKMQFSADRWGKLGAQGMSPRELVETTKGTGAFVEALREGLRKFDETQQKNLKEQEKTNAYLGELVKAGERNIDRAGARPVNRNANPEAR